MHPIVEALKRNSAFSRFLLPIDESEDFRDAVYFLRDDGTFAFSEGYYHQIEKPREARRINAHIFYVPLAEHRDVPRRARKELFGRPFENTTREIMSTRSVEEFYPLQMERYIEADPSQRDLRKPVYARFKAQVPVSSLIGCFPHRHSLQAIVENAEVDPDARKIGIIADHVAELVGLDISRIGVTGSLSLGTYTDPHDVDFVIYGSAAEVKGIVDFLYGLTEREEKRRVHEFGKFWPLRFWDRADGDRVMVCPFFSYLDPEEAPLRNFDCERLGPARVEARIADDTHNCFSPSVLGLEEVRLSGRKNPAITRLIIYHGAERGDWRRGDRVRVDGHHVRIRTYRMAGGRREPLETYEAVLEDVLGNVKKACP